MPEDANDTGKAATRPDAFELFVLHRGYSKWVAKVCPLIVGVPVQHYLTIFGRFLPNLLSPTKTSCPFF